ncbi:MAG: hypothetical protein Q8M92_07080 [Candidatus Subteraquimicrobiales bacterium]|nr:hypothetical protein [Candidatus Subteraquimicrobiales bacterium]
MGIFAFLSGLLTRVFAVRVLEFVAWKALIWGLIVVTFPIILINVWSKIIGYTLDAAKGIVESSGGTLSSLAVNFVGLAGWLGNVLMLPEGFSLLVSAVMFRVMLRSIPLLRL